ncbi:ParA family protein [Chitinimonas koreensis]|uniref:ParA family protein n=1 Tax=Chitinimonas koreensis TaxID=356302 RepID=UPI000684A433|nr:ParA family protein [Chitinimonas koreensis]QNM95459.1 ParA family protein [Chitinimonas koreensis]
MFSPAKPHSLVKTRAKAFSIAVISTKGGVGKTTVVANIGPLLAELGFRVLMIDADIQPSLSKYFHLEETSTPYGLTQVLHTKAITENEIRRTRFPNLDIVVSDDTDCTLQQWLSTRLDRGTRLKMALASPAAQAYDFILIDTQGAAGPLQEAAALAADLMVSPVSADILSAREFLSGTLDLLERLDAGAAVGAAPGPMRAVIYRQERLRDSHQIAAGIRGQFLELRGKVTMLDTVVPSSKVFREAATACLPVHHVERDWVDTVVDEQGRIRSIGSGSSILHHLIWELIPSLDGKRVGVED